MVQLHLYIQKKPPNIQEYPNTSSLVKFLENFRCGKSVWQSVLYFYRLRLLDGLKTVVDSGVLRDKTYNGGRIGVMSFSQEQVSWSKLFYRCNSKFPSFCILSEMISNYSKSCRTVAKLPKRHDRI